MEAGTLERDMGATAHKARRHLGPDFSRAMAQGRGSKGCHRISRRRASFVETATENLIREWIVCPHIFREGCSSYFLFGIFLMREVGALDQQRRSLEGIPHSDEAIVW